MLDRALKTHSGMVVQKLDSDHGGFEECGRPQLKGKTDEVRLSSPTALDVADYSSTPAAKRAAATSE